ncbi:MAG: hypothetical protein PHD15_02130 [Clostridia bacterium]|nr:hypothetical protein [Clostridia bacterium]MDD4386546.1 hypothetical protein [Clostridia bacterium]
MKKENENTLITKASILEKLFKSGFCTEKKILNMQLDDILKIPNCTSSEISIIIDFKKAIKTKKYFDFLIGNENIERDDKNATYNKNTTN